MRRNKQRQPRRELQGFFHFLLDVVLLGRAHHIKARVDHLGIVFHAQVRLGLLVPKDPGLALCDDAVTEFAFGEGIAPVLKRAFGELHDISLMHKVHAAALVIE